MRNYLKKSWMTGILVVCASLLMVFATYAEDSTTTTEEISTLSDGSVVLTVPDITQYRSVGDFEAPPAPAGYEGHIFSGWYTAQTCTKKTALADTVTSENIGENTLAYAKFVPKGILGVRAQVTAGTQYFDGDGKANIRFVTSVDSGNYLKVGFDCVQNGNSMHGESDTVYKKLEFINQSGKIMNYTPHNVFHDMSKYFMAATLEGVLNEDFGNGIVVTPYWITLDGTKVSGETAVKTVNMGYMSSMNGVTAQEQFSFSRSYSTESYSYFYVQGGCTDGTYYYEALSNSSEDDEQDTGTVKIYKYSLDGTKAGESDALNLHHANDITYNPDLKYGEQEGLLVVVHAKPARTRLSFVNPSDLTIVSPSEITDLDGNAISWAWDPVTGTKGDQYLDFASATTIGNGIFSLNYSSAHKKYVAGILGGQTFTFLEANLAETGTVFSPTGESKGFTTQGNTCDDGYVYFVLHHDADTEDGKKYETHIITVYDWSGNFVTVLQIPTDSIPVPTTDGAAEEPENISIHNNTMYISVNDDKSTFSRKVILYKVNGVSYVPTSTVATIERGGKTEEYVSLEDAMMDAEADETITIVTEEPVKVASQMEMIAENVTLTNVDGMDVTITRKSNYTGTLINNSAKNFTIKSNTTGSLTFDGAETVKGSAWIVNSVDGELNVKDVTVQNVKSNQNGGAVYVKSGTVTIERSVFQSNTADRGAAIYAVDGEQLTIKDSEFSSNISEAQGGAIYLAAPTNIDKCTFNQNETQKNNGGAISIASSINNVEDVVISNSTFDGNKAVAEGTDGYGEGSSINLPTGAGLTLVNCQFVNGQTREDNTISTDGYGDIRVANNNKSNGGGLNISGQMKCNVYLNGQSHLIVDDSLTENSEVVVNWRTNSFGTNTYSTFDGITYKNEDVMNASKEYISLSKNKTDCYLLENVKTTGTLVRRVKVADKADLQLAIDTIGETTEHTGYVEITEDIEIKSPVTIPEDANVTIIDDGKTSADVTTLYRGSGLAEADMFTVVSGATLTIQGKGQFVIDGRTQEEAEANTSVDVAGGCAGTIINNAGTLNLENMTIQYAKRTSSYGSVIRTSGSTTITDSTIANNYSTSDSGAIRVIKGSTTIIGSTFTNNKGAAGGVIFAAAGDKLTITNSTFTSNAATNSKYNGGAIVTRILTDITDCTFSGNTSAQHGGAISVDKATGILDIQNSSFIGNSATIQGGAIYVTLGEVNLGSNTTTKTTDKTLVKSNSAGTGGAIYANDSTLGVSGYTFEDNSTTTETGGAIYADGDGELNISQSVFESNTATGLGGAIHLGVTSIIDGCTFNRNASITSNGGAVSIASAVQTEDQAIIKNSTFDGNKATAVGNGVGEGSSINMPTGTCLTLENCQFTNGQTRVDVTDNTKYSDCGYGDIRVANSVGKSGLKISGKMVCDVFFNKVTEKLNVSAFLTEGSQVVANWRKDENNSVSAGFEGISYASEDVMNASKDYISLSANYNERRIIINAGTTGTLLTLIKVANETELKDAIATIGEIEEKNGFIKVTENFTINANVNIPADVDVTIIDDGTTSDDVTTLYRGSGLAGDMFTVVSGATLTIQGKGQFVIDGRTQEEAEANKSVDDADGCAGTIINNAGTLNLENMTIQYAKRTSSYGSVIRTSGSTTITDSTIANNQTTDETGAIRVTGGLTTVTGSTFTNNKGTNGGVIFASGGTQLTISNSAFEGNQSTSGHGGAIVTRIETTITDSTFTNNESSKFGGAIYVDKEITLNIERGAFVNNEATSHGGAICVNNNSNATINLTQCTFTDNQSTGGNGGAMFIGNNTLTNTGCTFSGNTAKTEAYNDIYQVQ